MDSTSRIDDDLSKLLVGPDASKTWRNIERVFDALVSKLGDLEPLETQTDDEIAALNKQLEEASHVRQESDSIRTRIEEMIRRVGWNSSQSDKEALANTLVEALSELVSIAQQAAGLNWAQSPISIDGLTKYCRDGNIISANADKDITRLEVLRKTEKRLADAVKRDREASELAMQAKRFIDAGIPDRAAECSKHQDIIATYSGWLAGLDADTSVAFSAPDLDMTGEVAMWHQAAVSERSAMGALLATAGNNYAAFLRLRDQSFNLAQESRQIAARILQGNPKPDECPLCHTQFEPGQLGKAHE